MKGKVGGAEENKETGKRDRKVKRENYGLYLAIK